MTDVIVCDASALVAALLTSGLPGDWAARELEGQVLAAPALVTFEAGNIIRRLELAELASPDQAAQAHTDLVALPIQTWPYEVLAARVWELRRNLSAYDASYVAVAEALHAPLVTLDRRIAGAPGLQCEVRTPPP